MKKGGKTSKKSWSTNLATVDRLLRFLVGEFLITFAYVWLELGTVAYLLYIIGTLLIVTAVTGYCWMYYFFNVNTCAYKKLASQTLSIIIAIYILLIPLLVIMMKTAV